MSLHDSTAHRGVFCSCLLSSLILATAGSPDAHGQCEELHRPNMHDFDQVRTARDDPYAPGLPGEGGVHCVPTTMIGWMAYLNQNGFPGAMEHRGGGAPYDHAVQGWETQPLYATVTSNIYRLGENYVGYPDGHHETDADKIEEWLGDHGYPRAFWSDRKVCNWDSAAGAVRVTAEDFANIHRMGGIAGYSMKWGRSSIDDSRVIKVHKGHFVTCTGTDLACDAEDQVHDRVKLMDPASGGWGDEARYTQSAYTDRWTDLVLSEADYWSPWHSIRRWNRLSTSIYKNEYDDGSWRWSFLDGIRWLMPTAVGTIPLDGTPPTITLPWAMNGSFQEVKFDLPSDVWVDQIEILPSGFEIVVPAVDVEGSTELVVKNIPAGFQQTVMTFPGQVTAMTSSPAGDLYVAIDTVIYRLSVTSVPKMDAYEVDVIDGIDVGSVDALIFDDAANHLMAITDGGKYVQRLTDDLSIKSVGLLDMGDEGAICAWMGKDSSHLWLAGSSSPVVREIIFSDETELQTINHLLPGISGIDGLHMFNDGSLLISAEGSTHLFEQSQSQSWKAIDDEKLTGLPSSGQISVSQSRFVWRESHEVDPEADVAPVPEFCLTDFDRNGKVGIFELLTIIDDWGHCHDCQSDLTMDGRVGIADLLGVIDAWGSCE